MTKSLESRKLNKQKMIRNYNFELYSKSSTDDRINRMRDDGDGEREKSETFLLASKKFQLSEYLMKD